MSGKKIEMQTTSYLLWTETTSFFGELSCICLPRSWLVLQEAHTALSFHNPDRRQNQNQNNKKTKTKTKIKLEIEARTTRWLDTTARSRCFLPTATFSRWNTRSKPSVKETPPLEFAART